MQHPDEQPTVSFIRKWNDEVAELPKKAAKELMDDFQKLGINEVAALAASIYHVEKILGLIHLPNKSKQFYRKVKTELLYNTPIANDLLW